MDLSTMAIRISNTLTIKKNYCRPESTTLPFSSHRHDHLWKNHRKGIQRDHHDAPNTVTI